MSSISEWVNGILSAAALAGSGYLGYRGMRASARAQERTALAQARIDEAAQKAAQEEGAGNMALSMARDLRAELKDVKQEQIQHRQELEIEREWRRVVTEWWSEHQAWDEAVSTRLNDTIGEIDLPPRVPLPPLPARARRDQNGGKG